MAQLLQLRLNRHDAQPWGFRLQGGKDFGTPLVVQKVNGGSIAEQGGLIPGDAVIRINNMEVFNLRHKDAQDIIVRSGNVFDITIQRGGSTWRPQVTPVGSLPSPSSHGNSLPSVTKTSLAHKPQEVHHIGSGYNNAARPFSSVNGNDGQVKSIVNKQYNTPVGIYSEEAIAETLSAQAEVLAGGVLGVNFKKNEKAYSSQGSEVFKFLQEQENDPSEPDPPAPANFFWTASHAIGGRRSPGPRTPTSIQPPKEDERIGTPLQQHTLAPGASHRPSLPTHKPISQSSAATAPTQDDNSITKTETTAAQQSKTTSGETIGIPACSSCGVSISGVFVRVKDKNLHVDCFKCATCGTSLKNQGYYNFNNKLYCDVHAKLAAVNNPPPGTEGYVPVPIKPTTKLTTNIITAAMNAAQHHQSNGTSHLITSPTSNTDPAGSVVSLPFQPTHSRTSSSSSSVGTTNSCISSLSPNISSTPEKLSPVHSRQSSGSGTLVGVGAGGGGGPNLQQLQQLRGTSVPSPTTFCTMSNNETTINHKQNENDMNSNNRTTSNGTTGEGGYGAPQTSAYNQFLNEYTNKKSNETTDGGYKSFPVNTNGSTNVINTTSRVDVGSSNSHPEGSNTESIYGTIRHDTKMQPNEEFQYVTLQGSVIKSVIPPGKGVHTNYKVHQGYGGPKPFNVSPRTPPISGPRSPATYPPPSQAGSWAQPKPATNPYATLPRTTGSSQDSTNIPVPPPFPPLQNGNVTQNGKNKNDAEYRGKATEMLANSLERLNINTQENFRVEAGKIISNMLEARLTGKSPSNLENKGISTHPMKNIIEMCDSAKPATKTSEYTVNDKIENGNGLHITTASTNGKLTELEPLETVIYRNKTTNPNAKRELTTRALDRRSYVEKDQQQDNSDAEQESKSNEVEIDKIANELKDGKHPICCVCHASITRGPFITALGRIWCPEHFICVNASCRRPLQDIGFVEEKGDLYCEYCFEKYLAPTCSKCNIKIKGDCLNAIGKHFHPECFTCSYCGKLFGNSPFFLEEGEAYCEADWNELFTTKCFACGFPVEAGDRWVEALNHNYHSQCFNCTMCKKNLEGQSFYNKGGRPFCKNHAR